MGLADMVVVWSVMMNGSLGDAVSWIRWDDDDRQCSVRPLLRASARGVLPLRATLFQSR